MVRILKYTETLTKERVDKLDKIVRNLVRKDRPKKKEVDLYTQPVALNESHGFPNHSNTIRNDFESYEAAFTRVQRFINEQSNGQYSVSSRHLEAYAAIEIRMIEPATNRIAHYNIPYGEIYNHNDDLSGFIDRICVNLIQMINNSEPRNQNVTSLY